MRIILGHFVSAMLCAGVALGGDASGLNVELGVALTPRHFPKSTAADVEHAYKLAAKIGPYAVFIFQWSQPDILEAALQSARACSAARLKMMLAISPTKLDKRDQIDAPKALADKVGDKLSFANEIVANEFSKAALELAKLKPSYLCLATEINFLAYRSIEEYVAFAAVCRSLYPKIKALSPETRIFVSFQWDSFRVLDQREPAKIGAHSKLIDVFRPLDAVAFTSYPFELVGSALKMPADYYDGIRNHVTEKDTVIISELGWPSGGKSNEKEQAQFIERLPALLQKVNPKILAWSLLHDVEIPVFSAAIGTTGLLTTTGKEKPGLMAFKALQTKP